MHTHHIYCIYRTSKAARIVLYHVCGLKNALYGTGFDVELVITEAVLSKSTEGISRIGSCLNCQLGVKSATGRPTSLPGRNSNPSRLHTLGLS